MKNFLLCIVLVLSGAQRWQLHRDETSKIDDATEIPFSSRNMQASDVCVDGVQSSIAQL